nr:putative reverse transcriptase domain-containing protein [Tanacetum cinerariifolium]
MPTNFKTLRGQQDMILGALSQGACISQPFSSFQTHKLFFKPRRVRAMNMTIQSSVKDKILAAQNEASEALNTPAEMLLTKSAYFLPIREDFKMDTLARLYLNEIVARHRVPILIISDRDSRFTSRLKTARDHQKSYADKRRKPLEFSVSDHVMLKVSSWKGVVRFGKKSKLTHWFVGPFETTERIGPVAYRLRLPQELNGVHDTFHVSNLKKCLADPTLRVSLEEIQVDDKLNFVEEPLEILKREFKKLKRSRITIVKVRWNSK